MDIESKKGSRFFLLFLCFLSGTCGLAYEVLYARLLSSYLGSMFYVSASILISFLLGIGLGALAERRVGPYLKYIELMIGIYSFVMAFSFKYYGMVIAGFASDLAASHHLLLIFFCVIILLPPALLIGICVPAFSTQVTALSAGRFSFHFVYAAYNLGAAFVALLIEFFLVRQLGVVSSLQWLSVINLIIFVGLFFVSRPVDGKKMDLSFKLSKEWVVLFFVSLLSGVFQVTFLKMSYGIWGPLNENFAIIINISLLMIAVASIFGRILWVRPSTALLYGAIAIIIPFIFLGDMNTVYSGLMSANSSGTVVFWIKYLNIFVLSSLPFLVFGMTVPLFAKAFSRKVSVRSFIAASSFGNAVGYFLVIMFIHEYFENQYVLIAISSLVYLSSFFAGRRKVGHVLVGIILVSCFFSLVQRWPKQDMALGYRIIMNKKLLNYFRNEKDMTVHAFKKFGDTVNIVDFSDGERWLSLNGYVSLRFHGSAVSIREIIVGLVPSLFSEKRDSAVVLGLGTGVTGGATAQVYKNTEIVEINPAVLDVVAEFNNENMGVMDTAKVSIQDGITMLINSPKRYDAIVNTATSPYYFSSNKLWSKEVLQVISEKLSPGGVYTSWVDSHLGVEGFIILQNTLKSVFKDCVYTFLSVDYFSYTCSNKKLKLAPFFDYSEVVSKKFRSFNKRIIRPYNFLKDLLVSEDFLPSDSLNKKLNTLSFPSLEYTFEPFSQTIHELLKKRVLGQLGKDPMTGKLITKSSYRQKCSALSIMDSSLSKLCKKE